MNAPKRLRIKRKPMSGIHMSKLFTMMASQAPSISAFQIHQVVLMFQVNVARYIKPKNFKPEYSFRSINSNGINAKKMATVRFTVGHAIKNSNPESSDSKTG